MNLWRLKQQLLLTVSQVLKSDAGEDAECHAAKLLEVMLLQYRGLIDQVCTPLIALPVHCLHWPGVHSIDCFNCVQSSLTRCALHWLLFLCTVPIDQLCTPLIALPVYSHHWPGVHSTDCFTCVQSHFSQLSFSPNLGRSFSSITLSCLSLRNVKVLSRWHNTCMPCSYWEIQRGTFFKFEIKMFRHLII